MNYIETKKLLFGALVSVSIAGAAFGHATSIGYENAGSPGAVTIWLGTYQHGGHHVEGSMNLVGVNGNPFPSTTVAFSTLVNTKPSGLIDGTTNFYVQGGGGLPNNLPLVNTEASWLTDFPTLPTNHWQGVTFNGLAAGDYQFTWVPLANPTQEWSPWASTMNGIFSLTGQVVNPNPTGVPDNGSSLLMLGGVLTGLAALARRRR
jgi:hypothetical protein